MASPPTNSSPASVPGPAACNLACPYAEPLPGDYADWIWCDRPGASVRVRPLGSDCPWARFTLPPDDFSSESPGS